MAPPGVGKGTQADRIVSRYGACHLSTGDIFRAALNAKGPVSPAMQTALEVMRRGELVSDNTVVELVRERLSCLVCQQGCMLDGFPRTVEQARALDSMLAATGAHVDVAINLTAPEASIIARLSGRRVCRKCKASAHLETMPPRVAGVCDACGGELYQREDDKPEAIRTRLAAFHATAVPVTDFYRAKGILREVDATAAPDAVFASIQTLLDSMPGQTKP